MDKQPAKTTGQQDTNAALAALAAAGNTFALGQLWEINKGLLHRLFWQWYSKNKAVADSAGLTIEDFDQEAFFAVQAAAQAFDPEKGTFATLLGYYVQNRISKVVCGEHGRLMTTEDGREVRISANPLNGSTSIDTPLDDTDGGSATLGDLQEDPAAAQAFQTAEDELYTEELHAALEEALNKLTAKQADVSGGTISAGNAFRRSRGRTTPPEMPRITMNKPLFLPCAEIPPLPDGMTTFCPPRHGRAPAGTHGTVTAAWKSA